MVDLYVLFVCTGNICRSPMAEYLMRRRLPDMKGEPWSVCSAGLAASYGMPASQEAVAAMRELGVDMSGHRSQPVGTGLVEDAALVVAMTAAHRQQIVQLFPGARPKTFLLKSFAPAPGGDVMDPIGHHRPVYRAIRDEIESAMPELTEFAERLETDR